jgi:hypothetical protein
MARRSITTAPAAAPAAASPRFDHDALYRVRFAEPIQIGAMTIRAGAPAIVLGSTLERHPDDAILAAERV